MHELDFHVAVAERLDELLEECEWADEASEVRSLMYMDNNWPLFREIQLCYLETDSAIWARIALSLAPERAVIAWTSYG